jgi:hypothetical protein
MNHDLTRKGIPSDSERSENALGRILMTAAIARATPAAKRPFGLVLTGIPC